MNIFNMSYGKWVEYCHEGATSLFYYPPLPLPSEGGFDNYFWGGGSVALLILRICSEGYDLFFSASIVNLQHLLLGAGSCGY